MLEELLSNKVMLVSVVQLRLVAWMKLLFLSQRVCLRVEELMNWEVR